jgi:hypothetical protein
MVTHSSGRDSFVSMVQSTNLRELVDSAHRLQLVRAADRNIFAQGQMSACLLSVVEVGLQDVPQTTLSSRPKPCVDPSNWQSWSTN